MASGYSKQTVAALKAVLKERGIPSTGLTRKQQIIDRLELDDSQNNTASQQPTEEAQLADAGPAVDTPTFTASTTTLTADEPDHTTHSPVVTQEAAVYNEEPKPTCTEPLSQTNVQPSTILLPSMSRLNTEEVVEDSKKRKRRSITPPVHAEEVVAKKRKQEEAGVVHMEPGVAPPVRAQFTDILSTANASKEEHIGDCADSSEPMDITKPDEPQVPASAAEETPVLDAPEQLIEPASTHVDKGPAQEAVLKPAAVEEAVAQQAPSDLKADHNASASVPEEPSPTKAHHSVSKDARFKGLFDPQPKPPSQPSPVVADDDVNGDTDEQVTTPSVHPATKALYVRNFMRPLQPTVLKRHLVTLATPPGQKPDDSTVLNSHLDAMRTHAFVVFDSISAASRVRSALHERVWPKEGGRKPLWSDFVPEEKVEEWVATELEAGKGSMKRFEVIYSETGDSVEVELREVGAATRSIPNAPSGPRASFSGAALDRRASAANSTPVLDKKDGHGVVPLAGSESSPARPQPNPQSFAALDTLFKSTQNAKPILYYLPVSENIARRRLDALYRAASHDWKERDPTRSNGSLELRRYTFEDEDVLVDSGSHFDGPRVRAKREREREAGGGGYGGYRGGRRGGRGWR